MAKKNYFLTLDTETTFRFYPQDIDNGKNVKPIWDIAWIITDNKGIVYETKEFYPQEYFKKFHSTVKATESVAKIERNTNTNAIRYWQTILDELHADIIKYDIDTIWAYNAAFDKARFDEMNRVAETKFDIKWKDLWNLAVTTQTLNKRYFEFCIANGYVSAKGNVQTSAEVMSRYLNLNPSFTEKHLALDDCRIEAEIGRICRMTQAKTKDDSINGFCWKVPQEKFQKFAKKV